MKLKKSKYDIFVETICLLLLCGYCLYLIITWREIPDQIPGHYNGAGEVDRWGSKGEILFLPIISWVMYIGITVLESFPQIWNTGVTLTDENKERVFRILKNMIATIKLLMICNFTVISINQTSANTLPGYYLPIFLLLVFGSILFFITKLIKNK